jgi:hypothetical protein
MYIYIFQCLDGRYAICKRNDADNIPFSLKSNSSSTAEETAHHLMCYFSPALTLCITQLSWSPFSATQHRNDLLQWTPKQSRKYILYLYDSGMKFRSSTLFTSVRVLRQVVSGLIILGAAVFRKCEYSFLSYLVQCL